MVELFKGIILRVFIQTVFLSFLLSLALLRIACTRTCHTEVRKIRVRGYSVEGSYSIHGVPECLSPRQNRVPSPPTPQASVSSPLDPTGDEQHSLVGEGFGGGGGAIRTTGQKPGPTVYGE